MKKLLFIILLLLPLYAEAANHYIRDGGTASTSGTGACTSWATANACDVLPATLVRGDTYYIATGTYPGRTYNTAASGTQVITIKGATATDHGTDTGWSNAYSVNVLDGGSQALFTGQQVFTTSYWVFDGSVGPAWSKDTSRYGFMFNNQTHVIKIYNTSTAITNFQISHVAGVSATGDTQRFWIMTDDSTKSVNNVTVSYSYGSGYECFMWATSGGLTMANWTIEYNTILNGWGSAANHGEDLNNNYGYIDPWIIRYNWFEGRQADGSTASIAVLNGPAGSVYIYGNVFKDMRYSDGLITGVHYPLNGTIYNNTFINCVDNYNRGLWIGPSVTGTVYNNLVYNSIAAVGSSPTLNYNAYFSTTSPPSEPNRYTATGNPFVDLTGGDVGLTTSVATAMTAGTTLAAPYNVDMFGTVRGADGKWDRGAIEFSSGGDTTPPVISNPLPSGSQACTSNPRNVTLQITTDENATCKYNLTDVAYDSMSNTFSTTGTTAHSQVVSLNCNASYTYYTRCMDSSSNKNTSSTAISFSIAAESAVAHTKGGRIQGGRVQ